MGIRGRQSLPLKVSRLVSEASSSKLEWLEMVSISVVIHCAWNWAVCSPQN